MKKLLFLIFALLSLTTTSAQTNETKETIFSKETLSKTGVILGSTFGMAEWDGSSVTLWTNRAGVVVEDKYSFGGFYSVSLNDFVPQSETTSGTYMDFKWAGGFFEYTWKAGKKAHITIPILVGGAELELDQEGPFGADFGETNFLVVEPSLLFEINLIQNLRFHVGGGYRFVGDFVYRNLESSDLSGFTLQAGFKVGLFR
jgi:hypothetical protein